MSFKVTIPAELLRRNQQQRIPTASMLPPPAPEFALPQPPPPMQPPLPPALGMPHRLPTYHPSSIGYGPENQNSWNQTQWNRFNSNGFEMQSINQSSIGYRAMNHLPHSTPLHARSQAHSLVGGSFDNRSVVSIASTNRDFDWERAFQRYIETSALTRNGREQAIQMFQGIKGNLPLFGLGSMNGSNYNFPISSGGRNYLAGSSRSDSTSVVSLFSSSVNPRIRRQPNEKTYSYSTEIQRNPITEEQAGMTSCNGTITFSQKIVRRSTRRNEPTSTTNSDAENEEPMTPQTIKRRIPRSSKTARRLEMPPVEQSASPSSTPKRRVVESPSTMFKKPLIPIKRANVTLKSPPAVKNRAKANKKVVNKPSKKSSPQPVKIGNTPANPRRMMTKLSLEKSISISSPQSSISETVKRRGRGTGRPLKDSKIVASPPSTIRRRAPANTKKNLVRAPQEKSILIASPQSSVRQTIKSRGRSARRTVEDSKIADAKSSPPPSARRAPSKSKGRQAKIQDKAIADDVLTQSEIVCQTRSGRIVKPPSNFWQVPAGAQMDGNSEQSSMDETMKPTSLTTTKVKRIARQPVKNNITKEIVEASKAVGKRGGRKKASPKKAAKVSVPAKKDQKKKESENQIARPSQSTTQEAPLNSSFGDLSFCSESLILPEISTCPRGGGVRSKLVKALAAQTPPLQHFMNNLHQSIKNKATPLLASPADWLISQRTQSEAQDFVKRKTKKPKQPIKSKKTPVLKLPKITKAMLAEITASTKRGLRSNVYLTDSESEEN